MKQLFNENRIREEFDLYYSQLRLIYESINFEKLRTFSYLRLKDSKKDIYHNFVMEFDDDKDEIYKIITIDIENSNVFIEFLETINEEYSVFNKIVINNKFDIIYSKKLVKLDNNNPVHFIPIFEKVWRYDLETINLRLDEENDYTENNSNLLNSQDISDIEKQILHKVKKYNL